jgi:hypothetical protein
MGSRMEKTVAKDHVQSHPIMEKRVFVGVYLYGSLVLVDAEFHTGYDVEWGSGV